MKIGIIYHSLSGQTRKLARLMQAKLKQDGHDTILVELTASPEQKSGTIRQPLKFEVTNLPGISGFDALCVGGPVWAFGPSTVTYKAILQMPELTGIKVLPFVTMGFPLTWMGGNGAIRHMSAALIQKGATVLPGIIVPKMFRKLDLLLEQAAESCRQQFQN